MSDIAIRVENLSKRYRLGTDAPYRRVTDAARRLLRRAPRRRDAHADNPELWALRDVSFEVKRGEVLGIIGRNGAGKSTLLKILSRITEPTHGRATLQGRVGSLLEVGTGFHQELTGRENIYLNGAILGMRRHEIDRKLDEIIDFSGIETFLDTPLKRYSTGMKTRLGFAVAAHLEPEILIVDEVLAVGDAEFQRRCLGKMGDVAKGGRTVLFVSHNMAAVQHLCNRAAVLDRGAMQFFGPINDAVDFYVSQTGITDRSNADIASARAMHMQNVIKEILLTNDYGHTTDTFKCGDSLSIRIQYDSADTLVSPTFGIMFETSLGQRVCFLQTRLQYGLIDELPKCGEVICHIPRLSLMPGRYMLTIGCSAAGHQIDLLERGQTLQIEAADYFGSGHLPNAHHGLVLVDAEWDLPRCRL